jgi:hypothetical protein
MPSSKVNRGKGKMAKTTEEDHDSDFPDPNEGFDSASDSDSSMDLSENTSDEEFIDVSNLFYSSLLSSYLTSINMVGEEKNNFQKMKEEHIVALVFSLIFFPIIFYICCSIRCYKEIPQPQPNILNLNELTDSDSEESDSGIFM